MKESQKRIKLFRDSLPASKQKVLAALLLLIMSAAILITYTYAWFTMSRAPEASKISTSISANGNLEIALCTDNATEPGNSQIGDSVAVDGNLVRANTTWGNVINLYDNSYGLSEIVLRPAQLNSAGLNTSPLWGAVYEEGGRVTTLDSDYTFFTWDNGTFTHTGKYGVRAIGTYKTGTSGSTSAEYDRLKQEFIQKHNDINKAYAAVMESSEYGLPKLTGLLTDVAQDKANLLANRIFSYMGKSSSTAIDRQRVEDMFALYRQLEALMENEHKEQLIALANFQQFVYAQNSGNTALYQPFTWDDIESNQAEYNVNSPTGVSKNGHVSLPSLTSFINDLKTVKADMATLESYLADSSAVFYFDKSKVEDGTILSAALAEHEYDIEPIAQRLLDYNNAVVHDKDGGVTSDVTVGSMLSSGSIAQNWSSVKNATLTFQNSILQRFELYALDSARLNGTNNAKERFNLNIKVSIVSVNMTCDLFTSAGKQSAYSYTQIVFDKAVAQKLVANDAILEDTYGYAVDFWLRSNASVNVLLAGATVKNELTGEVQRYDGVNRVWNTVDDLALTTESTTQGSGSCYVYYADSPSAANEALTILKSLKIAFVDTDGNLIASAYADTDNRLAQNGKYTVPFVLSDVNENVLSLQSNVATRLTALVYLDGNALTNGDVSAMENIQGLLNLQFCSDSDLNAMDDENLYYQTHSVSASADKTEMTFSLNAGATEELTTKISLKVTGEDPKSVEAFFLRAINASQGSREKTMTFAYNSATDAWETNYTFTAPGTFRLRSVRLDGIDYTLSEPLTITVKGFGVSDVTWSEAENEVVHYLTGNSYSADIGVRLSSDDKEILPKKVSAVFENEEYRSITTALTYNSDNDTWQGKVSFSSSGAYTLKYIVTDNELYYDLTEYNSSFAKKLTLYMNIRASVYNGDGIKSEEYTGNVVDKDVTVTFYDDSGEICTPHVTFDEDGNASVAEGSRIVLLYRIAGSHYTFDTDLTWNNDTHKYEGTLYLTRAGRYEFYQVTISGQDDPITKSVEGSWEYRITPPDGVSLGDSTGHYYQKTQVTLKQSAYIGPINIQYSDTAGVKFTVKNNTTGKTYDITYNAGDTVDPSVGYAVQGDGSYDNVPWFVYLPYSDGLNGKWTIEKIELWDCYDEDGNYHSDDGSDNIVWTADKYDFSQLSTYVTTDVVITLTPGSTTIGDKNVPFYTQQTLIDRNTYAVITYQDESGKTCTYDDSDPGLTLSIEYTAPTDTTYGYSLKANPHANISVALRANEGGRWTVEKDYLEWAVGEYKATLTASGGDFTIKNETCSYKLYSAAPQASDVLYSLGEVDTSSPTHNGAFLASYTPDVSIKTSFTLTNGEAYPIAYVDMPTGLEPKLEATLTYKDGSSPLSFSMSANPCKTVSFAMNMPNNTDPTYKISESKTLLPGTYSVKVTLTVNGTTTTKEGTQEITVNAYTPKLGISAVSQGRENRYTGDGMHLNVNALVYDYGKDDFKSSNTINENTANLFYEVSDYTTSTYVTYRCPTVTFEMTNVANGTLGLNAFSEQSGLTYSVGSVTGGGSTEPALTGTTVAIENFNVVYGGATFTFDTDTLTINVHTQSDMETEAKYVCVREVKTSRANVQYNGSNISNGAIVKSGDPLNISYTGDNDKKTKITVFNSSNSSGTSSTTSGMEEYTIPKYNISIDSSSSCIVEGSLVTLADGTQKKVEDLTINDCVLVFNHETGKYDTAAINFIENDGRQEYEVVYLHFSDGTTTGMIDEHGYFDLDLMKYVYLHASDAKNYIGHRFYKGYLSEGNYSSAVVTLTDVTIEKKIIGCYSLTTDYHLNFFVDDLLSMPGGIKGMFNFFDYDEDLKYNKERRQADIEKYGLCTYEDFAEYFSYETYLKYPAAYIKVALGKGLLTEEELFYLIERYAQAYEK